jgi:DNA-binding transcriptional LysR family regulator
MKTQRRELSGRIPVDLPVVSGRRWVLPIQLEIVAEYPSFKPDVSFPDRQVDLVEDNIDLAIRIGPLLDSTTLVAQYLGTQKEVLVAHPDDLARYGQPKSMNALRGHSCITFGGGGQVRPRNFLDHHDLHQPLSVRGRIGLNHSEAILDALMGGHGIALLADWLVVGHLDSGQLIQVLPECQTQGFPIHAVWQKNKHLSGRVRHVVDLLVERFQPEEPWDIAKKT